MAELIRQEYRLPAVRFSMQFVGREPVVQIRAYHGQEELDVVPVPAADVGIRERLSVRAYRSAQFQLPRPAIERLAGALSGRGSDDTVWLQIDRSAGFLAVVPWERLLAPAMPGPLLRIPNFLADPAFIEGPLQLAVCASAPAAKQFYPVADFTIALIERIQQAVAQGTDIHVFADRDAGYSLQNRFAAGAAASPHRVTVHDPARAVPFGAGESAISESEQLRSPWLRWMEAELGDSSIDAVHFVCPGYFNSERGFLALARSPVDNEDEAWSHFVGCRELCTFLDDLGAGAVALGAPHEDAWALGLRLLADDLAWTRPGPVIHYEADGRIDAVAQAYQFLFSDQYAPPPGRGGLLFYCHPRRLDRYHEVPFFVSPSLSTADPGHEWLSLTREQVASKAPRLRTRGPAAAPPEPRWARANRLMIEQSLLDLGDQHGAAARGASDALRFLSDLQSKYLKETK
ncbi:MAG: hypothetical protein AB1714_31950 [Acidobacteriota bacterium]